MAPLWAVFFAIVHRKGAKDAKVFSCVCHFDRREKSPNQCYTLQEISPCGRDDNIYKPLRPLRLCGKNSAINR